MNLDSFTTIPHPNLNSQKTCVFWEYSKKKSRLCDKNSWRYLILLSVVPPPTHGISWRFFLKKIFRFFVWTFFDKLAVKVKQNPDLGYVCRGGGGGLFKGSTFGFWDFLVQFQGDFSKEIFLVLRNFGFGVRIPGEKCSGHKKKASVEKQQPRVVFSL